MALEIFQSLRHGEIFMFYAQKHLTAVMKWSVNFLLGKKFFFRFQATVKKSLFEREEFSFHLNIFAEKTEQKTEHRGFLTFCLVISINNFKFLFMLAFIKISLEFSSRRARSLGIFWDKRLIFFLQTFSSYKTLMRWKRFYAKNGSTFDKVFNAMGNFDGRVYAKAGEDKFGWKQQLT